MDVSIAFEPNILAAAAQIAAFAIAFTKKTQAANGKLGTLVKNAALARMNFKNPTGVFESSLEVIQSEPGGVMVGSPLPYGWRLEEGFEGPDKLGRVYHEPGMYFFTYTLQDSSMMLEASQTFIEAILEAWGETVGATSGIAAIVGSL